MAEEVKIQSEKLKSEFILATKPQANWKSFVHLVLLNYQDKTNCVYGFVVYDWIVNNGYLPEEYFRPINSNVEKSAAMDELIAKQIFTIEQLKNLLSND